MTFSETQRRYSTIERELTAIRWGCYTFKPFIYGIRFTMYTDHKPLIYLNNMAPHNARIHRTLEDLSEYNFDIKYRPGALNDAADYLSRLQSGENGKVEVTEREENIPEGLKVYEKVDGGGDSLFAAVILAVGELEEFNRKDFPTSSIELRRAAITELIEHPGKYNICKRKNDINRLKIMLKAGNLPCYESLLSISHLYGIEIRVYHNMKTPVIYKAKQKDYEHVINLQCIGMIHFNPLYSRKKIDIVATERTINTLVIDKSKEIKCEQILDDLSCLFSAHVSQESTCQHSNEHELTVSYNDINVCAFLDIGSQVSIIDKNTFDRIKTGREILEPPPREKLVGIGGGRSTITGIVYLEVKMGDHVCKSLPFAVVKEPPLMCCILLGLNFAVENLLIIDHGINIIKKNNKILATIVKHHGKNCSIQLTDSESIDEELPVLPRFNISDANILAMQRSNHAIIKLRQQVKKDINSGHWSVGCLKQFRKFRDQLKLERDILVKRTNEGLTTVVSFPFMVEILHKVHRRLAHVGRHKLLYVIKNKFWHPAADKIAREICATCNFCQFHKTNVQQRPPPSLRINAQHPFHIVAMDLVQFPKTSQGNNVALCAVDLYSKWVTAVPLKTKTSKEVARALKTIVIPCLPKVPTNILSDNGGEFKGKETEEVLKEFNIRHVYSTPFKASSNGAIERVNRTLKDILKATISNPNKWDQQLPRAVVTYNNTYHSHIKSTPSEMLLGKKHVFENAHINENLLRTWKVGHPNFSSFKPNQKVLKKIEYKGKLVKNKFLPNFQGPFTVVKLQSNGVTYELKEPDSNRIIKAHHRQLREFKELPNYIQKYISDWDNGEGEETKENKSGNLSETDESNVGEQYYGSTRLILSEDDSESSEEETEGESEKSKTAQVKKRIKRVRKRTIETSKDREICSTEDEHRTPTKFIHDSFTSDQINKVFHSTPVDYDFSIFLRNYTNKYTRTIYRCTGKRYYICYRFTE